MMDELERPPWEILSGYRVFAIDGDHLPESDKRLEPLRETTEAPPPGTVAARFDLQREVFDRELDKPTRNNDTVIHLLSNLPARIPATRVAEVYGFRWNEEQVDEVSPYHVSVEIERYPDGMMVALDDEFWTCWMPTDPAEAARRLREIARGINPRDYRKSRRGPKKPKASPKRTHTKTHISTAQVLAAAKQRP